MTRWLSRRHPRYVRSIVYMLQASEYDVAHFFKWHEETTDFTRVEKRRKLDFTTKAVALYAVGWLSLIAGCVLAATSLFALAAPWSYVLFALILLELPLFALGGILAALVAGQLVQKPLESRIIRRATAQLAAHKAVKIAIAGSYGKTSMREMLTTVLAEGKNVAAPGGSYNTPLGISTFAASLKGDEDVLVFEFGEYYPGDIKELCEMVRPDIGVITGVNEAHLEKFGSLDKTAATIFELADYLGDKPVYVNAESRLARERATPEHILYGPGGAGYWRTEDPTTSLEGTTFALAGEEVRIIARSKLLGLHQVGPLSAAADIARRLGLAPLQIEKGITKTVPFSHRLEPHFGGDGVVTIDDSYNGNPDGVRAAIDFLAALPGRRWYVTPGLVEAGPRVREVHTDIGRHLARAHIEKVVLIRNSVTPFIEEGLSDANFQGALIWYDDALLALKALPAMTVKGDIVLLQNDWPDQYF